MCVRGMHAVCRQDSCVCLHSYRKFSFTELAWRLVMVCNAWMQWWALNRDRPDPRQFCVTDACKMRRTWWYIYLNFIKITPRYMKDTFFFGWWKFCAMKEVVYNNCTINTIIMRNMLWRTNVSLMLLLHVSCQLGYWRGERIKYKAEII